MSWNKNLKILACFVGTAVGTMHVINRVFSYIATADNYLGEDECEYYDWRFGKIAYRKTGSGSPILLVHNFDVCSSMHEWKKVEAKLAKTNTVYSLDLLGCGCSEHPILTYTNFLYVQLINDFIKNVIGKKTDVIVSGKSVSFVLMACANDETIINRIVMISPESLSSLAKIPTKRSKFIKYLLYTPVIGTFIYNMKINKRTIHQKFYTEYYYDVNSINEKDILTCFEASHRDKTRSRYLYACQQSRYTNANILFCLSKLNNSIFIISGNGTPKNALIAEQYQNHIPSIEIIGINNTKELPHVEKANEFLAHVHVLLSDEDQ